MKAREQFIETPRGKLWVATYGEGKGRTPLLVIHGGPGFLSMPQEIRDLADERPVVFYDQLGCGRSDRPADPDYFTVAHYVNELAGLREALGLAELHIMAQSWGAMLAVEYVLRRRPEGVRSLILCGPLLSSPRWESDQRRYINRLPSDSIGIITEAEKQGRFDGEDYQRVMMDYYRRHVCRLDPWPDYLLAALGKLNVDLYLKMWGPSEFTTTGSLKGADLLPRLPEIEQSVLLVCGEHDEAAPDTVQQFRDALRRGEMAVIPAASHSHHLEQPEIFRLIVRNFLDRMEEQS